MADLTITAAQVLPDSTGDSYTGTAGGTLTAGQAVYLDDTVNTVKAADANASAATARAIGIALHAATAGQPIRVQRAGDVTLGTGTAGTIYVVSANAGGIAPAADLASGHYVTVLGVGITGSKLRMPPAGPFVSGQVV